MGLSHDDVARRWSNGESGTGCNMYTDGRAIYSYGDHFPIAFYINGITLFNQDGYSVSTAKHKSIVHRYTSGEVIFCSTKELQKAIENPDRPIIITKTVNPRNPDHAMEILRTVCRARGMKRFPMKKLKTFIEQRMFLDNL